MDSGQRPQSWGGRLNFEPSGGQPQIGLSVRTIQKWILLGLEYLIERKSALSEGHAGRPSFGSSIESTFAIERSFAFNSNALKVEDVEDTSNMRCPQN